MDEQKVKNAQSGDLAAFEKIIKAYDKKIYNIALRATNNDSDAFDLTQEVFLRIYRGLPSFKFESSFSTWVYKIASNLCIDFVRKQSKKLKLETSFITTDSSGDEQYLEVEDLRYSPETALERSNLRALLENAISKLSPVHRQVFILREVAGLSYGEIAEVLSIEEGTVKSRLARCREKLRIFLTESGNFSEFNSSNT